jgi:hypothetical protein
VIALLMIDPTDHGEITPTTPTTPTRACVQSWGKWAKTVRRMATKMAVDGRLGRHILKTAWTVKRLERLYARYNWHFWQGRLPHIPVRIAQMKDELGLYKGLYEPNPQRITLDIRKHKNDREIRSTLLHEIAHAAAGERASEVHGSKF